MRNSFGKFETVGRPRNEYKGKGSTVSVVQASVKIKKWEQGATVEVDFGGSAESRLPSRTTRRVVLVEIGVAGPTAEAKTKVAASARDWEEEEVMTVEL